MKNIITGWATTLIGLTLMVLSVLQWYSIVHLPAPQGISPDCQLATGFIVGLILFLLPRGVIENALKKIIDKKTD